MLATVVRLARSLRLMTSPIGRGQLAAHRRGFLLFQPVTVTWPDRHPALFATVTGRLADTPAPRLLSFGCSTGAEAFTLARYLPRAQVDAVDANPACIARARLAADREGMSRVRFACADSPDAFAAEPYDAVFCLSVLRHGALEAECPEACTGSLPFSRFEAAVAALDRCVRPGGYLVLWGCHFRFTDTSIAARYRLVPAAGMKPQPGPFYGPNDRLLPCDSYAAFVFRKKAGLGIS